MAVQPGFRPVNNMTRQGPGHEKEFFQIGPNASTTKCLPGIAVVMDTTDNYVKEYGSSGGKVIGFLSYENSPDKPATIDTPFKPGDWVAVERGAGKSIRARLATGENVAIGQELKVTTDGYLAAATINGVKAVDESGSATVSTGNDDIIADAEHSVNASSAAAPIWILTRK
ncbi:MAG: hypothetical protein PHW84_01900 [Methanosarcina sp.]|nr:hypothetical protein [Methanosarcina sp.]